MKGRSSIRMSSRSAMSTARRNWCARAATSSGGCSRGRSAPILRIVSLSTATRPSCSSNSIMELIDGKAIAAQLVAEVGAGVETLRARSGIVPGLAVVLVGDDPASTIYVRRKLATTVAAGMRSFEYRLAVNTPQAALLDLIDELNANADVHGILVQLPLPPQIDPLLVLDRIAPEKDVDGFHPVNVGRLSAGGGGLVPCTPLGCMKLLDRVIDEYHGLNAVVIGKSNIVGKPIALLLLEREA